MADERLELIASVKNLTSGPIRDIQRSMRALAADSTQAHKLGIVQSKDHTEQLYKLRREVTAVGDRVRNVFSPALTALGVGGLSAAAGIAAVTKAVSDFSTTAHKLTALTQFTGMSANQIRTWEELAGRIGSTSEAMDQSLKNFNDHMEKLRRAPKLEIFETFSKMNVRPDPGVQEAWLKFFNSLSGLSRSDQFSKVLAFAQTIRDISQRKVFLEAFGAPGEFAALVDGAEEKLLAMIKKYQRAWSEADTKIGEDAWQSFANIKLAVTGLAEEVGVNLAPKFGEVTTALADFIAANREAFGKELAGGIREVVDKLSEFDWKGFANDIKTAAQFANKVAEGLGGWKVVLEYLAVYKLAQIFGITAAIRGLAGAFGLLGAASAPAWLMPLLGALAAAKGAEVLAKDPGAALGLTGPRSFKNNLTELWGMTPWGAPAAADQFKGNQGDKDEAGDTPAKPWWKRLLPFSENSTGIMPAAFHVEGGGPNPLLGGADVGGARGLEGVIERGTLQALRDFAAEQKAGGEGGGGGGGGVTPANYSPSGSPSGGSPGSPSGAPAGDASRPSADPMGSLTGKPRGITSLAELGAGGSAQQTMAGLVSRGWSPEAAAMMAGNIKAESNFNTGATGDRGTSVGLAQWHGPRARALMDAARAAGKDWRDRDFQLDFLDKEFRGRFGDKSVASHDFNALSRQGKAFEGYATNTFGARVSAGQQYLRNYNSGGAGKPPHFGISDIRRSLEGTSAEPGKTQIGDQAAHHYYESGTVTVGGQKFHWGSGGAGAGALPFGTYPVNIGKGDIGPVGQRIGSVATLGAPGGEFTGGGHHWSGVQIHRAFSDRLDHLYTRGCFSVSASEWPAFKQKLLEENAKTPGGLNLTVGPNGMASITARGSGHDLVPTHASDPSSPKRWGGLRRPPHGAMAGVKAGILPFGESPNAKELRKMGGGSINLHRPHREPATGKVSDSLLGHARQAGFVGAPLNHKVTGSASVDIRLANFPKGTITKTSGDGMFKQVKLSRGRSMPAASQES
jgi:Phage tail lysozyme